MSNCQKEVKSQKLRKYKPYKSNFVLFKKRIFTNKETKSRIFLGGGGGRGIGVRRIGEGQVGKGMQKCKITNMNHHRIHVQKIYFFFFGVCVGGGSSYGRYEHESCHILYTLHIAITSST